MRKIITGVAAVIAALAVSGGIQAASAHPAGHHDGYCTAASHPRHGQSLEGFARAHGAVAVTVLAITAVCSPGHIWSLGLSNYIDGGNLWAPLPPGQALFFHWRR